MINSSRNHNHVAGDHLNANPPVLSALIRKQIPSVNLLYLNEAPLRRLVHVNQYEGDCLVKSFHKLKSS